MNLWRWKTFCVLVALLLPAMASAQTISGWADDIKSLHSVLDRIYDEMIPKCDRLIGVARGLAAFGALWFIASRVWGHIIRAESVDVYPLFSPFVKGFAILIFPSVIGLINGVMQPTVTGTSAMVEESDAAIAVLLKEKEEAVKRSDHYLMYVGEDGSGDYDKWYRYTHDDEDPAGEGWMESIGNNIRFAMSKAYYNFRNSVKEVIAEVLQLLFAGHPWTVGFWPQRV
jgi:conjugative transposon TraJ protein